MKTNTKLTVAATLGAVMLGTTLIGAVPALAAGNTGGSGDGMQSSVCQAANTLSSEAARISTTTACAGFVDADGDGVCDNRGTGAGGGYGVGNGSGSGAGSGAGFVDADGDGACDNRGTGAGNQGSANGGNQGGGHHGKGNGRC